MLKKNELFVVSAIILVLSICISMHAKDKQCEKQPINGYFWIDDTRVSLNAIVQVKEQLEANGNIFYCIILDSVEGRQYIECFDTKEATAKEWKDSFIMAFKEGSNEA